MHAPAACTHGAPSSSAEQPTPALYSALPRQNLVMVAGGAIFALYEVSTALSVREQRRLEAAGDSPVAKIAAKVCQQTLPHQDKPPLELAVYNMYRARTWPEGEIWSIWSRSRE